MEIFPLSTWRLLHTPAARGAWNMAVDEAILESVGREESLPTLRLYAWEPACLSLGYAQPFLDVDLPRLHTYGWDLVRRPTGGKAILHTDELTYSVSAPPSEPRLAGSVLESYQRLSQALLYALHLLGVPAEALEKPRGTASPEGPSVVCFESPSNYEITIQGKKLIGSAQARRREGVLQHGSLPLYGDLARITQALTFPDETRRASAAERLLARATTIQGILKDQIEWEIAAGAFAAAFQNTLNLELVPGELTESETERARALVREKYANPAWQERV